MTAPARSAAVPLFVLVLFAFAWRLLLAATTPVPSEDGVSYLWMAEQFARGDFATPLSEVFPPLLSLLMAPSVHLQITPPGSPYPLAGGPIMVAALGALAVLPIARLAVLVTRDAPRTLVVAGWLAATAALPARLCAEVYTEPVFAGAIAAAAAAGVRGTFWRCGAWAGAAFWLRPEALLLPIAFCLLLPRQAWRSVALAAVAVVLLALWRHAAGHGFDLLPKLDFNLEKANVGGDGVAFCVLDGIATLPSVWLEAYGVAGVLALFGLIVARKQTHARPLALTLLLGLIVIVAFAVRRRFLVAWWPLIVPFAMVALLHLRPRWRLVLVTVAVALGIAFGLRTTDANRVAEREVAAWLQPQLHVGERFVTDLTRVLYFAGARPLPPRHLTADELIARARAPGVRFLVLGSKRATAAAVRAALPEFQLVPLPAPLAERAAARGIEVRTRV